MDRLIYTAMTGASHVMQQQAAVSENLSNNNTPGFRAAINTFRAVPLQSPQGLPTRTFVVDSTAGADFSQGTLEPTGRELDVAVNGQGWFAVQTSDGKEAYTRNGSFQTTPNGILQTRTGLNVVGESGPITLPPNSEFAIGKDGTITATPTGPAVTSATVVGRLKLVNPDEKQLVRGEDGMFRTKDGQAAQPAAVEVSSGHLEGSNVNVVDGMVQMIALSRQFDMQMKMLQTANEDARQASQIFSVAG